MRGYEGVRVIGSRAGPYRVDVHDSLDAVRLEWQRLARAGRVPLFHHPRYLDAYAAAPLHPIARAHYLLARDGGGDAVAALPLFLQYDMDPLGVLVHQLPSGSAPVGLLSHVWHCYDTRVPAAAPLEPALLSALLDAAGALAAQSGADWYGLVNVEAGGELAHCLDQLAGPYALTRVRVDERFTLDLDGCTGIEDFIAGLSPRQRQHLRRFRRRAGEAGLAVRVAGPAGADLDGLLSLVQGTMAKFGAGSFFPPGRFQRFVSALGDRARVLELRVDGRLVAGAACLLDEDRLHFWISGTDYDASPTFSPNYLLFLEAIHEALRRGARVFEGGRRNGEFKERFGLRGRELLAYVARTR
ncbi:GNAT family N-acetyltransferase [Streptomyces sp. ODS28]|uniref:GNAT family N-acetyltransferase n=1 Tax=Streptomyces sp. ODS28 TaxID=3136688 RepID=UPI0031EF9231